MQLPPDVHLGYGAEVVESGGRFVSTYAVIGALLFVLAAALLYFRQRKAKKR